MQTFQRFTDQVLRELDDCFAYVDDILLASRSENEHMVLLRNLFDRVARYEIKMNPEDGESFHGFGPFCVSGISSTARTSDHLLTKLRQVKSSHYPELPSSYATSSGWLISTGVLPEFSCHYASARRTRCQGSQQKHSVVARSVESLQRGQIYLPPRCWNMRIHRLLWLSKLKSQIKQLVQCIKPRNNGVQRPQTPLRAFENGSQGLNDREICQLDFITSMRTKMCHISGSSNVVADSLSRKIYAAVNHRPSARDVAILQSNDPAAARIHYGGTCQQQQVAFMFQKPFEKQCLSCSRAIPCWHKRMMIARCLAKHTTGRRPMDAFLPPLPRG
ncbi:LOW QUALITY PROTEIN: hypothetical protein M514_18317 [Trichuris suis]|uniref:Reverse transcriptase domain-containing protein n=1 Tax=Trichuris suis TaxID=68888 RepID=A0A085NIZ9_9BILA|nr:LOW QUALITY PROTEIN: hypothetical protein M514_18317 [Trichuris suis]